MKHKVFASVIIKVRPTALAIVPLTVLIEVVSINFSANFKESLTLQLIIGISNDLQKLLKYFNGTAIFTPDLVPYTSVSPTKSDLYLNDEESAIVDLEFPAISSLLNCHKIPDLKFLT